MVRSDRGPQVYQPLAIKYNLRNTQTSRRFTYLGLLLELSHYIISANVVRQIRSQVESVFSSVQLVFLVLPRLNMHSTLLVWQPLTHPHPPPPIPKKGLKTPIPFLKLCLRHLNTSFKCFVLCRRFHTYPFSLDITTW